MNQVPTEESAKKLFLLIKQLLIEKEYDGVKMLFQGLKEAAKNLQLLSIIPMDIYNEICQPYLCSDNNGDAALIDCVSELFKLVAQYAPLQELMLEIMERIEESKNINIYTAYLRALQVILLRHGTDKPQAVEWCLHSVFGRLRELPLPAYLSEGYDEKQGRLLEQDAQIEDFLAHYITTTIFHEPLIADVQQEEKEKDDKSKVFRDCGLSRRNIYTCFFIQMLGKPLALLEMSYVKGDLTLTYVQQVVKTLTVSACKCIGDPYYLLGQVEQRARWERKLDAAKGVYELSNNNIFLIEDKMSLHALGMYYHSLFVGDLLPANAPKVYAPLFLFEAGIYLAAELLKQEEPPLQHCGIRLIDYLLNNLKSHVTEESLQQEVHKRFCEALCRIVGFSPQVTMRQSGLAVLRRYILCFDDAGRYFVLKNLIETLPHDGLRGHLSTIYKDLACNALKCYESLNGSEPLPDIFRGIQFRAMLLLSVCVLPNDVKSDLLQNGDRIFNALNIVRFFALRDKENVTGFWDMTHEVEEKFLQPLSKALDFSLAHYKAYKERVKLGQSATDDALMKDQLSILSVNVTNSTPNEGADHQMPDISREEKLEVLESSITSLELILSLYLLTNETVETGIKRRRLS